MRSNFTIDTEGNKLAFDATQTIFGREFEQNIAVANPKLWSPESPYLYKAVSRLYVGNELKDEVTTRFGIRQISYQPATGFQLNGKTRKFKGICLHHDLGQCALLAAPPLPNQLLFQRDRILFGVSPGSLQAGLFFSFVAS